jgi:hypothetical protein
MLALHGFLVAWGFAAVALEFVHVVLSEQWRFAAIPLAMLSIAAPLRMLTAFPKHREQCGGCSAGHDQGRDL